MFVLALPPVVDDVTVLDHVPTVFAGPAVGMFAVFVSCAAIENIRSPTFADGEVYDGSPVVPLCEVSAFLSAVVPLYTSKTIIHFAVIDAENVAVIVLDAVDKAVVAKACIITPVPEDVVAGAGYSGARDVYVFSVSAKVTVGTEEPDGSHASKTTYTLPDDIDIAPEFKFVVPAVLIFV